jgi:hypothetical protein
LKPRSPSWAFPIRTGYALPIKDVPSFESLLTLPCPLMVAHLSIYTSCNLFTCCWMEARRTGIRTFLVGLSRLKSTTKSLMTTRFVAQSK